MSNVTRRLVVFGGSGFLGKEICKAAVQRGWSTTSLSRNGEPQWLPSNRYVDTNQTHLRPQWASQMTWQKADIFDPSTYKEVLQNADAVVHTMGILLESDYKNVLRGQTSPLTALKNMSSVPRDDDSPQTRHDPNPLMKKAPNSDQTPQPTQSTPLSPPKAMTYESMNRDSAVNLASDFSRVEHQGNQTRAFLYISGAGSFPTIPQRYISTKREAENLIAQIPDLRSIFIRPSFMYSPDISATVPLSYALKATSMFNNATSGVFSGLLGAAGQKPLQAHVVGQAVIKALEDDSVHGVVDVDGIESLASKVWREEML